MIVEKSVQKASTNWSYHFLALWTWHNKSLISFLSDIITKKSFKRKIIFESITQCYKTQNLSRNSRLMFTCVTIPIAIISCLNISNGSKNR